MTQKLLKPIKVGELELANRIFMAPLTRSRAGRSHIPTPLLADYYAQRASAGLIFTEATMVAADGCAFTGEAGLYNDACVAGWRLVTDAVHRAGGRIVVQLWHPGRAAHSELNGGAQPISSSDRPIRGDFIHTPGGKQAYEIPRRLNLDELPGVISLFQQAAANARAAGFDGVEIHGAHGYLLDQFLRDSVNDRQDRYGGSIENRARLLFEAVDAAVDVFGAGRVGLRISPLVAFNDIRDSDPEALVQYVATESQRRQLAYFDLRHDQQDRPAERRLAELVRAHYRGTLSLNGGFDRESAEQALVEGRGDAIQFGLAYIANPDLVERIRLGAPLNIVDPETLYSPGPAGYVDYPKLPRAA